MAKRTEEELYQDVVLPSTYKNKIDFLNRKCEEGIQSGFTSSALGVEHVYQSERDDQFNILGLKGSTAPEPIKCGNGVSWEYRDHTPAQIEILIADGKAHKYSFLLQCDILKKQVESIFKSNISSKEKCQQIEMIDWIDP